MKQMKAKQLIIGFLLILTILSCGSKNNGKWTDADIEKAKKNALFSAQTDPELKTDEQRQKFVDCWVDKVITTSPNPMKQSEIPMNQVIKFGEDCRAEALK